MRVTILNAAFAVLVAGAASLATAQDCWEPNRCECGWYAGVEYLLLKPDTHRQGFDGFFYEGAPGAALAEGSYSNELQGGLRFEAGHVDCCGRGARGRYFAYDNTLDYTGEWDGGVPVALLGPVTVDIDVVDLELTKSVRRGDWELQGAAGARYGKLQITDPSGMFAGLAAAVFGGATGVDYEGVGPTVALELGRRLGDSGTKLVGRGRMGLLFGDAVVDSAFLAGGRARFDDEFTQVWEFQLGVETKRALAGHRVDLGAYWETQYWDSESGVLDDFRLHGVALKAGLSY
ncbi:hypothetical protein Mal64_35960 [Pseudobythopirellula maris]|uniref:Outer membrane protein beta-barrel domain-containing protein n=1 Tax=Pseudobythopirellula maris TaxID=2527991 RepID=A0A5C5ZHR4_9BACT|nr:hypothetical protein [Pseudobythopirellula maris]TWT86766.1 hypothetical protein Mal64_35960 [Pseudobythopirellula maris]